jgi:NADH-quinone oxidoreductase subunit C
MYKLLNDICIIDYPNNKKRFQVIYNITSIQYNNRLFVKTYLEDVFIDSIVNIFSSAG